jgi:biotin operon repressor
VSQKAPHSIATLITDLAAQASATDLSPADAREQLDALCGSGQDLAAFLTRKGMRLPETQQLAVLHVLQAAEATDFAPVLQKWSQTQTASLRTRLLSLAILERWGVEIDQAQHRALQQAGALRDDLQATDTLPLHADDSGQLAEPLQGRVLALPLCLALDVARSLAPNQPHHAIAVLQTLRPMADNQDRQAIADGLAVIPIPESAAVLQHMLGEVSNKTVQKAIKKALHRLKAQGVHIEETAAGTSAVLGTASRRLEQCLASHIDAAGNRALWMIRTKPFGGYYIAYLIVNYGQGIQSATGLSITKRDLPDLIAQTSGPLPLIELEPAYCQYQVALIHQMNLATGTPVPDEFFSLRDIIGETHETFDKAIIYTVLPDHEIEKIDVYEAFVNDLLEVPEFAGWRLPDAMLQVYGDQLRDLEQSQIVVSEMAQRERISAIYEAATTEALSGESRRIMRLRLEEMAYYLWQTDRRREALWAVAAAKSLETDIPERLQRNRFVGALLRRSLDSVKQRPSRHIILPYTSSAPAPSRVAQEEERRIII